MNSHGQATDGIIIFIRLFVFLILVCLMALIADAMIDAFSGIAFPAFILQQFYNAVLLSDYAAPLGFGLFVVLQFVSGYRVPTKPFFVIISLFVFIISLLAVGILNNAFDTAIASMSVIGADNFPLTLYIMDNMFLFYIIMGFAWMFGFYLKSQSADEGSASLGGYIS